MRYKVKKSGKITKNFDLLQLPSVYKQNSSFEKSLILIW